MMALLFAVWALPFALAWVGRRREALIAGLAALALSAAMLRYHTSEAIRIDL